MVRKLNGIDSVKGDPAGQLVTIRYREGLVEPALSDPEHQAIDAYDVVYNEQEGHAQPAVFIISPQGTLLYEAITSGPIGRPTPDDLLLIARGIRQR